MGAKRITGAALALAIAFAAAACQPAAAPTAAVSTGDGTPAASAGISPAASTGADAPTAATGAGAPTAGQPPDPAPPVLGFPVEQNYPVGTRTLALARGTDRALRTLVFYPAVETAPDAEPAAGRFPLILFSHGLRGSPEHYTAALTSWAAAGFIVAAPEYPHTHLGAAVFDRADIVNQPADAGSVIKAVRALNQAAGDPLAGHISVDRVAAVGHSAGGYTTTGLFAQRHPTWLRAGVVIAGWLAPGAFAGPRATILFVQGERDSVVPLADGREAFDAVPWAKSFLLLPHSWHADYMLPGGVEYPLMDRTVIDFLRWTLNDDEAAHLRLPPSSFPAGEAE